MTDDNPDQSGTLASAEAVAIRDVIVGTPGVQSVGDVRALRLEDERLVRAGIRRAVPSARDIVLEPEVAAPRVDANPPTDVFVIRGAE